MNLVAAGLIEDPSSVCLSEDFCPHVYDRTDFQTMYDGDVSEDLHFETYQKTCI
jgi:hypothetical protein